ncbi:hypothetical protein D9757_012661 [Collybiopsis confluens]|uniref:Uncharacterized protein n=1 Tax=Collybiopsis confluens TaxID=2823264 RepID=A0A8H5GJA9_9AGAR|nr:hypothetical protein D9757_012661 [Collybiopsis confluens]
MKPQFHPPLLVQKMSEHINESPPSPSVSYRGTRSPPSPGVSYHGTGSPPSPGVSHRDTRSPPSPSVSYRGTRSPPSPGVVHRGTRLNRAPSLGDSPTLQRELASSTAEILSACPQLRILVIGEDVAHDLPGVANINSEITSEQNPLFILHDSEGFQTGETHHFETVKKFIDDRAKKPELKDKLHAIWFCMEIPTENGALFQIADENFLQLALHGVPVIVVFTKFDLLVSKMEREATDIEDEDDKLQLVIRQRAEEYFQEVCVRPLRRITSSHTYAKVSKKRKYRDTLIHLVNETKNQLDENMWVLWAMAQRASVDAKIDACIAVGRTKYWKSLASSLYFSGRPLTQCLRRIHDDMIDIWNFNDPDMLLKSLQFKLSLTTIVNDLVELDMLRVERGAISEVVTGLIGIISDAVPGAALATVPIVATLAIAQWLYAAYQKIPVILQLLMGYICDLSTVLQCLWWIMNAHGPAVAVEPHFIDLAIRACNESGAPEVNHRRLRAFVAGTPTFEFRKRDRALDELIMIIESVRFLPDEKKVDVAGGGEVFGTAAPVKIVLLDDEFFRSVT